MASAMDVSLPQTEATSRAERVVAFAPFFSAFIRFAILAGGAVTVIVVLSSVKPR